MALSSSCSCSSRLLSNYTAEKWYCGITRGAIHQCTYILVMSLLSVGLWWIALKVGVSRNMSLMFVSDRPPLRMGWLLIQFVQRINWNGVFDIRFQCLSREIHLMFFIATNGLFSQTPLKAHCNQPLDKHAQHKINNISSCSHRHYLRRHFGTCRSCPILAHLKFQHSQISESFNVLRFSCLRSVSKWLTCAFGAYLIHIFVSVTYDLYVSGNAALTAFWTK